MSKFLFKPPVIHIPSFKEYRLPVTDLVRKYEEIGVEVPFPWSDYWYYHTDAEGWAKLLPNLLVRSNLYKAERFDCDKYARKSFIECCERYGLNTLLYTYGSMPLGAHGWNTFYTGDAILQFEPNEGFKTPDGIYHDLWGDLEGDIIFGIGDNRYIPQKVLV
ncbi:MAG: hypothetical protein PHU08_02425 [Dehalococcoidales bacterium]|nr:hypothetical protein [Dehalococcoidales bacterium]